MRHTSHTVFEANIEWVFGVTVGFKFLIYSFSFPISLRVIGHGESDVILEETGEFSGKSRRKLWSSVGDHLRVEAKSRENMSEKELSDSGSIDFFCAGAINYPLHKVMVYHDHDRIETVRVR